MKKKFVGSTEKNHVSINLTFVQVVREEAKHQDLVQQACSTRTQDFHKTTKSDHASVPHMTNKMALNKQYIKISYIHYKPRTT